MTTQATTGGICGLRERVSGPWLAAFCVAVCLIWGNSLVPGDDSGSLSMAIMEALQGLLAGMGLPYEWVTNFLVRKTAHFTEYLALGLIGMQAFKPHHAPVRLLPCLLTALALVAVPCCDETIQLFVQDRSGQATDVLIDCCGAAAGAALTVLISRLKRRAHA